MGELNQSLETRVATGRGRPTLYRPELCERAREHCRHGASLDQLAGLLGVAPRSIDNWIARIPEFAAAVRDGRADAEAELDRLLYRRAVGFTQTVQRAVVCGRRVEIVPYTRYVVPDARACMRWLCRNMPQDWRRRPDLPLRRAPRNSSVNPAHLIDSGRRGGRKPPCSRVGYVQPVERVMVCHGEPLIVRYTRQRRPHTHAGMFWLCNRLPEQWSYEPFLRAKSLGFARGQAPRKGGSDGDRKSGALIPVTPGSAGFTARCDRRASASSPHRAATSRLVRRCDPWGRAGAAPGPANA